MRCSRYPGKINQSMYKRQKEAHVYPKVWGPKECVYVVPPYKCRSGHLNVSIYTLTPLKQSVVRLTEKIYSRSITVFVQVKVFIACTKKFVSATELTELYMLRHEHTFATNSILSRVAFVLCSWYKPFSRFCTVHTCFNIIYGIIYPS